MTAWHKILYAQEYGLTLWDDIGQGRCLPIYPPPTNVIMPL